MVLATAGRIGLLVASATPAAFKVIQKTCDVLTSDLGDAALGAVSESESRAVGTLIALKAACEVRAARSRKRRRA